MGDIHKGRFEYALELSRNLPDHVAAVGGLGWEAGYRQATEDAAELAEHSELTALGDGNLFAGDLCLAIAERIRANVR